MAIDERERPVLELLDEMGIQYRCYEHPCARTMHDCEGIGADIGAQHFKNLFLCNRSGTKFYLLLICADKPFRTGHPCVATASLAISMEDLLKYIGWTGNEIKRVHIE